MENKLINYVPQVFNLVEFTKGIDSMGCYNSQFKESAIGNFLMMKTQEGLEKCGTVDLWRMLLMITQEGIKLSQRKGSVIPYKKWDKLTEKYIYVPQYINHISYYQDILPTAVQVIEVKSTDKLTTNSNGEIDIIANPNTLERMGDKNIGYLAKATFNNIYYSIYMPKEGFENNDDVKTIEKHRIKFSPHNANGSIIKGSNWDKHYNAMALGVIYKAFIRKLVRSVPNLPNADKLIRATQLDMASITDNNEIIYYDNPNSKPVRLPPTPQEVANLQSQFGSLWSEQKKGGDENDKN